MQRSWLDSLTDLVDAAPIPRWTVYAVAIALWSVLAMAVGWATGAREFPQFAVSPIIAAIVPVVFLWSTQILNGVGDRALKALGPALTVDAATIESIARDLKRTPPGWALLAVPVGAAAGIAGILSKPESWELTRGDPAASWVPTIVISCASIIAALGFVIHAIHQMRLIEDIHRGLVSVDLFHLEPLYSFARLTSLTGITLVAIVVGGIGIAAAIVPGFEFAATDLLTFGFLIVVAIAVFVVPLRGLHDRIETEKDRRLAEAQTVLVAAVTEMQKRITAGDIEGAARVNDALAAANLGVEVVSRVPTWPWRTETLRGFLSAVFLPIALWLAITLLGRLLPA